MIRQAFALRFRALLSGSPDGVPPWTADVADGQDFGLFAPSDAPWIVHADIATTVGGIRALLMQTLHPGSLAGVVQHSRYEEDVVGRLNGTIRWLTISTFGSRATLEREADRVRALHERVRGTFTTADGLSRDYRASDADLLQWVHVAFADSFLTVHQLYGRLAVSADDYVRDWGAAIAPLGLRNAPDSAAGLRDTIKQFAPDLRVDERTRRVVRFVQRAPLPRGAKPAFRLLFWAAVDTLPDEVCVELGLRRPPRWLIRPATRLALRAMRIALGSTSPLEEAALSRITRLRIAERTGPTREGTRPVTRGPAPDMIGT